MKVTLVIPGKKGKLAVSYPSASEARKIQARLKFVGIDSEVKK